MSPPSWKTCYLRQRKLECSSPASCVLFMLLFEAALPRRVIHSVTSRWARSIISQPFGAKRLCQIPELSLENKQVDALFSSYMTCTRAAAIVRHIYKARKWQALCRAPSERAIMMGGEAVSCKLGFCQDTDTPAVGWVPCVRGQSVRDWPKDVDVVLWDIHSGNATVQAARARTISVQLSAVDRPTGLELACNGRVLPTWVINDGLMTALHWAAETGSCCRHCWCTREWTIVGDTCWMPSDKQCENMFLVMQQHLRPVLRLFENN